MFLDYKIHRLLDRIQTGERRRDNIASGLSDDDLDGHAYVRIMTQDIVKLKDELDKLRAKRYGDRTKETGGY